MVSSNTKRWVVLPQSLFLLALTQLAGCGGCGADKAGQRGVGDTDLDVPLTSANYYLGVGDLNKFRPGPSRVEILQDLQWREGDVTAAQCNGEDIWAITYDLLSDGPESERGEYLHAIFVNGKFVKFIRWLPGEMEEIPYQGTTWRRPKRVKLGDCKWLVRATNATPVKIEELRKEVNSIALPPKQTDIGLTIAWLLLRPSLGIRPASPKDYKRNAALRDQFNAARLDLGMTEAQVESVLKAKPLESGRVEAGDYRIYGSNESFRIDPWLHFSNIIVVFRQGKAVSISGGPAGEGWRRKLAEGTIDLPEPGVKNGVSSFFQLLPPKK